jgi:DNA-directed RNA polymerase subunit beta
VNGRSRVYEAIVKGQNLPEPGIPESFNVLVKELQALGIKVTMGQSADGYWGSQAASGVGGDGTSSNGAGIGGEE